MTRIIRIMAALALVCGFSMTPILPEPLPAAMTAGAVLDVPEEDLEKLACAIYSEAGGDECSDECRMYVGDVVLNRIMDSRFPDTMEEVLTQRAQYGRFYWTGIVWPSRAQYPGEARAVERAYETARKLLSGEHSEIYGEGYVWQAEFTQGTEGFWCDGMYFGK